MIHNDTQWYLHQPSWLFWAGWLVAAAELNSVFTQQPSQKFRGAVRLGVRFWVVFAESASSCRSVNNLTIFCKEAQHLARHTGGAQVTPAAWTRWTDDGDRLQKKCFYWTASAVESDSCHILQEQPPSGKDHRKSALLLQRGYAKRLNVSHFHERCHWLRVRLSFALHDSYLASPRQGPQRAGLDSVKAYLSLVNKASGTGAEVGVLSSCCFESHPVLAMPHRQAGCETRLLDSHYSN